MKRFSRRTSSSGNSVGACMRDMRDCHVGLPNRCRQFASELDDQNLSGGLVRTIAEGLELALAAQAPRDLPAWPNIHSKEGGGGSNG